MSQNGKKRKKKSNKKKLFDENQTITEQNQLNKKIRTHNEEMEKNINEGETQPQTFMEHAQKIDNYHQHVSHMSSFVEDSKGVAILGKMGESQFKKRHNIQSISRDDFVTRIKTKFLAEDQSEDASIDWGTLGKQASQFLRAVHTADFFHATIVVPPKIVKERKKSGPRKPIAIGPQSSATTVNEHPEDEKTATAFRVAKVDDELSKMDQQHKEGRRSHNHEHFWKFVVDPNSFTATIEKMFDSAFLVKSSRADVFMEHNQPLIRQGFTPDKEDFDRVGQDLGDCTQNVIKFNYKMYQDIINTYGLKGDAEDSS